MLFVTIFLGILGIAFLASGARAGRQDMVTMGAIFLIAGLGGAMITFFSLSAF